MKKITIYIFMLIGICFIIPIFFTTRFKTKEIVAEEEKVILDIEKYSYANFEKIKLLHSSTGVVEEVRLR